ncbi:hypothetical protein [Streptomyces sp.]|uniref:hypothetical protein n=1 Tax=Streptomyces sp. TaxID=1931 RepID=UPI002F92EEF6
MSDQWGTREQPSARDPGRLCAEHVYLLLGVFSISAAIVAYVLDATLPIELNRGLYAILVAFFVAGYCGWLSRSAERRGQAGRDELRDELHKLAAAVEELRTEAGKAHVTYLPRQYQDSRHVGRVAVGDQGDTVPLAPPRTGLDAQTEATLRRINMRLLGGGSDLV